MGIPFICNKPLEETRVKWSCVKLSDPPHMVHDCSMLAIQKVAPLMLIHFRAPVQRATSTFRAGQGATPKGSPLLYWTLGKAHFSSEELQRFKRKERSTRWQRLPHSESSDTCGPANSGMSYREHRDDLQLIGFMFSRWNLPTKGSLFSDKPIPIPGACRPSPVDPPGNGPTEGNP